MKTQKDLELLLDSLLSRVDLDVFDKKKNILLLPLFEHGIVQPAASRYTSPRKM